MMRLNRKTRSGFTLVELIIVMVIVGVLASIAVPSYLQYVRKSHFAEAKTLVTAIERAEREYLAVRGYYYPGNTSGSGSLGVTSNNSTLCVNATNNKCFKTYSITVSGTYAAGNLNIQIRTYADASSSIPGWWVFFEHTMATNTTTWIAYDSYGNAVPGLL